MAGSKKLKRWQISAVNQMNDVVKRPDFKRDVKKIRAELEADNPVLNVRSKELIKKYNLPRMCFLLVRDYLLTGGYGPAENIPAPIMLLSFKDNYVGPDYDELPLSIYLQNFPTDHVAIDLTGEIQKQDLIDFVNSNWKLIESKLKLIEPTRPGAVKSKQRDKLHLEVLKLREKGLTYNEIAAKKHLEYNNVKQILYRMRHPGRVDRKK